MIATPPLIIPQELGKLPFLLATTNDIPRLGNREKTNGDQPHRQ